MKHLSLRVSGEKELGKEDYDIGVLGKLNYVMGREWK